MVEYGNKVVTGIFNRFKRDINFNDRKLRLAFNLTVDRQKMIKKDFGGYADPVPALTPPWAVELPKFDELYKIMASQIERKKLMETAKNIDRYVYDEAVGLHLCSPQSLYAVNRHVKFRPYRTTSELADTDVNQDHWSTKYCMI